MHSLILSATLSVLVFVSSMQSANAVNIAIVDSGLNSNILGGVLEPGGFDFVNNDADPSDDSTNSHGTAAGHVAISSGSGITLTAIKAYNAQLTTTSSIMDAAFNYVATLDGVKVVSHSGASVTDTPLATLKAVVDSGKVIVLQAGNFAGASPVGDASKVAELNGRGIVAGGVTPDGMNIQSFSNRAGFQQDWYIMAQTNSLITSSNGTSMATPRVAAAAATLFQKHSFLSPEQVVQILLNTATDLGEAGVDPVYGHGVLSLEAALSAAGAGNIPDAPGDGDGDGGGGGGGGAAFAAIAVGGGIYYALTRDKKELQRTILVDEYGRAFTFDFANRISVRDTRPSIFSLIDRQQTRFDMVPLAQTTNSYTQALVTKQTINPYRYTANDDLQEKQLGFLHRTVNLESEYAMALNADLSSDFGALSLRYQDQDKAQPRFSHNDLFTTPILGYSNQGSTFMYGWNNENLAHRFGVSIIDEQELNGQISNSLLYESRVAREQYHVGFQLGALVENGSLLGGASDSVLGVDQTSTYYLGLNGSYKLSNDISLLGGYFQGVSSIEESNNSLLSNFSGVRTEGYALGVLVDNLFSTNGSFGLSYSSPLQTIDGSATLTLPVSQDMNTGDIGFESSNLSFSDADKEKVIEAYYNYQLTPKNNLFTHISYTQNPISNLASSQESTIFIGWKHRF